MHKIYNIYLVLIAIFVFLLLSSCNRQYQKVLRSDDTNLKLEYAENLYNEGNCVKALPLLRDLLVFFRGTPTGEKINYYYSYCQYSTGQYIMASYYFERLLLNYPHGQYAEDAAFFYANSLYFVSPGPSLDQTNSIKAIRGFQNFVNRFPNSDRVEEAHQKMDELLATIETKEFQNAVLYYQIHEYRAAVWALRSFIQSYPLSKKVEKAHYLIVKSQFNYASLSIEEKQEERFRAVLHAFNDFYDSYPESDYITELENIISTVRQQLKSS